MTIQRL